MPAGFATKARVLLFPRDSKNHLRNASIIVSDTSGNFCRNTRRVHTIDGYKKAPMSIRKEHVYV